MDVIGQAAVVDVTVPVAESNEVEVAVPVAGPPSIAVELAGIPGF